MNTISFALVGKANKLYSTQNGLLMWSIWHILNRCANIIVYVPTPKGFTYTWSLDMPPTPFLLTSISISSLLRRGEVSGKRVLVIGHNGWQWELRCPLFIQKECDYDILIQEAKGLQIRGVNENWGWYLVLTSR